MGVSGRRPRRSRDRGIALSASHQLVLEYALFDLLCAAHRGFMTRHERFHSDREMVQRQCTRDAPHLREPDADRGRGGRLLAQGREPQGPRRAQQAERRGEVRQGKPRAPKPIVVLGGLSGTAPTTSARRWGSPSTPSRSRRSNGPGSSKRSTAPPSEFRSVASSGPRERGTAPRGTRAEPATATPAGTRSGTLQLGSSRCTDGKRPRVPLGRRGLRAQPLQRRRQRPGRVPALTVANPQRLIDVMHVATLSWASSGRPTRPSKRVPHRLPEPARRTRWRCEARAGRASPA